MKKEQVEQLKACAKNIHEYLKTQIRHDGNFLPPPLIIEIAGHPSCGKSTVIGKLDTSLRRLGFKVGLIQEGAQAIRNIERSGPEYNRATALYSSNKLYDVCANTSLDIVIFERCVFDAVVWPEYWNSKSKLESREMVDLQNTYLADAPKIDLAFFVVCDPVLAIKRELRVEANGMQTLFRELEEEVGILPEQLSNIQYVGLEDLNSEITRVDKRGYTLGKRYFVFSVKYSGTNNLSINK